MRTWNILAIFQARKVAAHVVRAPRVVTGDPRDVIPVAILRDDGDHRVVRRASAQGARTRIPYAIFFRYILTIPRLLSAVRVVADEVIPGALLVFGRETVKDGDFVHVASQIVFRARIAARFEQQDFEIPAGKIRGERAAARAGPN